MAFPTSVNSQITDAVTQTNVLVNGSMPAVAVGSLQLSTAQALGLAALNAAFAQQQSYITAQASTAAAVATILSAAGLQPAEPAPER